MNEKKLAVVLAATQRYLQDEDAACATAPAPLAAAPLATEPGAWAQAGRHDLMSGRRMLQLRAFCNR